MQHGRNTAGGAGGATLGRFSGNRPAALWGTGILIGGAIGAAALRWPGAGAERPQPSASSLLNQISPDPLMPIANQTADSDAGAGTDVRSGCTVTDGDTIRCGQDRIRLAAIDAPELPGHCNPGRACTPGDPYASSANLDRLIGGRSVTLRVIDQDRYGRLVACVAVNGQDLSHAQVEGGFAVERYRPLSDCLQ